MRQTFIILILFFVLRRICIAIYNFTLERMIGKNDVEKLSKKFTLDIDLKIILLNHRNTAKNFDILTTSLNILYNYFDGLTKLFSELHLVSKFLDTSAKFFRVRPVFKVYSYI